MDGPRLLDLFCGAGGCSVGYRRAGFTEIVGVDVKPQPRYPFAFVQDDALKYLAAHGGEFDAIHASPPCQLFSSMNRAVRNEHPDLVGPVRAMLVALGRPYAIENVEGAPLLPPCFVLCGTMFGLRCRRHRVFEVRPTTLALTPGCTCRNGVVTGRLVGHRVGGKVAPGRTKPPPATEADRRAAIGVPWMTGREARQAIPPAYTEFVGKQLIRALEA